MTRLIHLNGPSGVGKSTLAERYVDAHPGTLNLDIDRIVSLVGGWQDDFGAMLEPARRIAIAGAAAHLASGHDVVVPQLVTDLDEAARFEETATQSDAEYVEIAMTVARSEQSRRFRGKHRVLEVDTHVARYIEDLGGDELDPEATYDALLAALH